MQKRNLIPFHIFVQQCAVISKYAGGIGLACHNIRASNSYIRGTNGSSNGIVPMLRVFNNTARYVDQGGGKRKGIVSCSIPSMSPQTESTTSSQSFNPRPSHPCQPLCARCLSYHSFHEHLEHRQYLALNWSNLFRSTLHALYHHRLHRRVPRALARGHN